MNFLAKHIVPAPRSQVWHWHTRPGAVVRLTPGFSHMKATSQASSLADGTTTFQLPAKQQWVALHLPFPYSEGRQFADTCINAPFKQLTRWTHTHLFDDAHRGTAITDSVSTTVPGRVLEPVFAYRQHQLAADLGFWQRHSDAAPLTVGLTGSHGMIGTQLKALLTTGGHTVIDLVRGKPGEGQRQWKPGSATPELLDGLDAVIHLAGAPIAGWFTEDHKREVYDSRVEPTRNLAQAAAETPSVKTFISASAVGFYGRDRGETVLTESSERGEGFLADVVADWEDATTPAREAGKRVVNIRTGLVMSSAGGMLPILAGLTRAGINGPLGGGQMWMPWISIDDLTDIYATTLLDDTYSGPVNAAAPHPVRNAEFTHALGRELHRPTVIPVPGFAPATLLGPEGARELALANQHALPTVLQEHGHHFRHEQLGDALAHELGGEALFGQSDTSR